MERVIPDNGPDKAAGPDLGSVADELSRESDRLRKLAEELKACHETPGAMLSWTQPGGKIQGATTAKACLPRGGSHAFAAVLPLSLSEQNPRKHGVRRRSGLQARQNDTN
ncbi:MAG TPA: hypothetical protein DDY78_27755 [Planctomycetales bacterium]|jgi:hypothetical protein|nr:hypothetical protein [Planctomycetales bacterium]